MRPGGAFESHNDDDDDYDDPTGVCVVVIINMESPITKLPWKVCAEY